MFQLIFTQVDDEGSSEERPIFTDRIKVRHGVIIARNPSAAAEKPDYLVSKVHSEASLETPINVDAHYELLIEIKHGRRI